MTAPKAKKDLKGKDKKDEGLQGFSGILEKTLGQLGIMALSVSGAVRNTGMAKEATACAGRQEMALFDGQAPIQTLLGGVSGQEAYVAGAWPVKTENGFSDHLAKDLAGKAGVNGLEADMEMGRPLTAEKGKVIALEDLQGSEDLQVPKDLHEPGGLGKRRLQAQPSERRADKVPVSAWELKEPAAARLQTPDGEVKEAVKATKQGSAAGEAGESKKISQEDQSQPVIAEKGGQAFGEKEQVILKIKVAEPYHQVNGEFSEKLSDSVARQMNAGVRSFEIQLEPEHLGKVEVRISVTNGQAVVELSCASHKTAELLSENARAIGALMEQHSPNQVCVEVKQEAKPEWYQEQGNQNQGQGRERQPNENRGQKDKERNESGDFMEQLRLGLYKL